MKQKLFKTMLLLCALVAGTSMSWATEEVFYTLTPANGSNNSYTGNCDVEIDGITWNITGNSQMQPWRLGGKSISGVDRAVYSKTTMGAAITKVELTVGAASSITVNSLTLVVASDDAFSDVIDEVEEDFEANSTITFTPSSPATEWPKDSYYKFVFNVTVSGSSNKFVQFTDAKFYKEAAGGAATTTTIDDSGITNTDVYTSTTAGSLSAAVTVTEGGAAVGGATVTWSGDNDAVATINASTGAVTLVGVGTVTFTASYAGSAGVYAASSKTYEMTVTSSEPLTNETLTFSDRYNSNTNVNGTTINGIYFDVVFNQGTGSTAPQYYMIGTAVRSYAGNNFVVSSSEKCIEQIDLTFGTSDGSNEITANKGSYDETTIGTWTGKAKSVRFFIGGASGNRRIESIKVYYGDAPTSESVTVTSVEYATFASDFVLDFEGTGIKAFYATVSGDELTFHQINKVPANTGVLLYKEGATGSPVNVPVTADDADDVSGNVFVRGTGAAVSYADGDKNYILFDGTDGIGFYQADNNTVAANKAYIHVSSGSGVKYFLIDLDDDATGLERVQDVQEVQGAIYNLAGQRLSKMQKGINIVNGKKILY